MTRILLIDDDAALLDVLSLALEDAGYAVETAPDGRAGLARIEASAPALVVTDVNMPEIDGFTLCRKLRDMESTIPVILLTSRVSEIDEALGLELGADDYVSKPFSTRVLLARIAALLRRQAARDAPAPAAEALRCGRLELAPDQLRAHYDGTALVTTLTEFRMLEALVHRPGVVLSRDRLLDLVRGGDSIVGDRIIDTYVRRLRGKLEAIDPGFDAIETVIGAGYRWKLPDA